MKAFVAGSRGMLARDLIPRLSSAGFETYGGDIPEFDITDQKSVRRAIGYFSPDVLVNCAAYTAVDRAETEHEQADRANRLGPAILAEFCTETGIPLIHLSTDYIFDGEKKTPYKEHDSPSPLGVYGKTKLEGEQEVRRILANHAIIRSAWLFGYHGNSFVKTILRLARERDELRIVDDQIGCPTWTGDLADGIVELAREIISTDSAAGTWHYCGKGQVSWYGFAKAIVEEAGKYEKFKVSKITPITTDEYPLPAKRPLWSVLDCSKFTERFGIEPLPWREGLIKVMEKIYIV